MLLFIGIANLLLARFGVDFEDFVYTIDTEGTTVSLPLFSFLFPSISIFSKNKNKSGCRTHSSLLNIIPVSLLSFELTHSPPWQVSGLE